MRTIDADFLNFLYEARRELASDLIRQNDRADLLEGTRLNEGVQRILDRLLFLMPKLRAAKSDAERKTLQNAVSATDQQINALVYELYGLTKDEIKLVEGTP
jgi:hypothetical protein